MSFFEDSTVIDVVEATIAKVDKLEEEQQRKMLKVFRKVRNDLQDRLLVIPPGTFTEHHLQVTLVQVAAAIEAIKRDLKTGMVDSSDILATQGVEDLVREIETFGHHFEGAIQPLNIKAAVIASSAKSFLINKHEASIDAYGADLRSAITSQITQSMVTRDTSQRTVSSLVSSVGRYFIGEEWKLNRIVRTELHNIYNFSKMQGMADIQENTLPDLQKSLMHPMDSRTGSDSKKLANINPIVDIDQPFRFKFNNKERVFMFPPDRPNDRAILVPVRKAWTNKEPAAFTPGA